MSKPILAVIILAAGQSKRMHRRPKAALDLAGHPLAWWALQALSAIAPDVCLAVVGHEAEKVKQAFGASCQFVLQREQKGTGHAVRSCEPQLRGQQGEVVVVSVDHPLMAAEDLIALVKHHRQSGADATVLYLRREAPGSYGRIVKDGAGKVLRIVEAKDAGEAEKAIKDTNLGIYCFSFPKIFEALAEVGEDNAQGEQYLTDVIEILNKAGGRVEAIAARHEATGFGINTQEELAEAESLLKMASPPV
jgi:bifunctional UDP-N-acetylglucosamine pyrophosphorylase/glucosamine-1-phosphate N-acetyltransferase